MKTWLKLAFGAALLGPGTVSAETDYSRLRAVTDAIRDRRTEVVAKLIGFWSGTDMPAAPFTAPARYPLAKNYGGERLTEAERAVLEKRARAVTDYILTMPSLRGSQVSLSLVPEVTRVGFAGGAVLDFTVRTSGAEAPFRIELGAIEDRMYDEEDAGPTAGGCARWQTFWPGPQYAKTGKEGTERIVMRIEKGFPAIPGVQITPMFRPDPGDPDAEIDPVSAQGRAAAAIYAIDCDRLLKAANAVQGEEPDF